MSLRFIIGFALFSIAIAGVLIVHAANSRMAEELDRHYPDSESYSEIVWSRSRSGEILAEYRRRFPEGTLRKRWRVGVALWAIGMAGTAACVFLPFR